MTSLPAPFLSLSSSWSRNVIALLASAVVVCVGPSAAHGAAPSLPKPNVQLGIAGGWEIKLFGPDSFDESSSIATEVRIERNGKLVGGVRPPDDLDDQGCTAGVGSNCLPAFATAVRSQLIGRDGLLVTDQNHDGVPEFAVEMDFGQASCCKMLAGYWRTEKGWIVQSYNSGSAIPRSTVSGRIRVGDPAFDTLDWPFSRHQTLWSWIKLIPGRGWVGATTGSERRAEISRLTALVKRFDRAPTRMPEAKSARAVIIAHEAALDHRATTAGLLAAYGRKYGVVSRKKLERALGAKAGSGDRDPVLEGAG